MSRDRALSATRVALERLDVLLVEDSPDDAELISGELLRAGFDASLLRVETEGELRKAAREKNWDVVLSDNALPTLDAAAAIAMLAEVAPSLPLIVVSGAIGEESAVGLVRKGASDYVNKGRLDRLGPAIRHSLREREARSGQRQAEAMFRGLLEAAPDPIVVVGEDPANLIFEVTETAAIANMGEAREFAAALTRLGCRFALDDFGAGFGSFYYLKYLPSDFLKIDGDFISSLPSSGVDQVLVQGIVAVARGLGMRTIAEYVEDAETLELVRSYGVDFAQGFHVGRPLPTSGGMPAAEPLVVAE